MDLAYEDEDKIVWLKDHETLARMAYVREKIQLCGIRTCPVKAPQGEMLIGYAVLKKTAAKAGHAGFRRRIFTLLPEDLDPDRDLGLDGASRETVPVPVPVPPEAVDPLSVQAGKPSRRLRKRQPQE
ncbi:MAG TPA: DUF6009 family protein [Methanothrix sp.]